MAQRTRANYKSTAAGVYTTNGTGAITGALDNSMHQDMADSVAFILDDIVPQTAIDTNSFESFDWISDNYNAALAMGYLATFSGTAAIVGGSSYGVDSSLHAQGVIEVVTGTTAGGWASFAKRGLITFGTGSSFRLRMRNALETLSNGTDRYTAWAGYFDNWSTGGEAVQGAYFRYNDNVNGGKWQAVTRRSSVETAVDTGVAGAVGYSIFDIQVNSAGTLVTFTIDNNAPVTISTNIPTLTLFTTITCKIQKSIGTNVRQLAQDWYSHLISRTTAR